VGWLRGTSQKSQVGEGWADFVATASWYGPRARRPAASGWNMEDAGVARTACVDGSPRGELHAAQFFWDLYDAASPEEPVDDVQLDFATILSVWSLFRGAADGFETRDRTPGECDPHGRNLKDFLHYYESYPTRALPDARGLVRRNCLEAHLDGVHCGARE
jgi:hypothetical protein